MGTSQAKAPRALLPNFRREKSRWMVFSASSNQKEKTDGVPLIEDDEKSQGNGQEGYDPNP